MIGNDNKTNNSSALDMQKGISVVLIDDDKSIIQQLEKRLPSVMFNIEDIDTIERYIYNHKSGLFSSKDLIFLDTFYRDTQYAIDFFEDYRTMSEETIEETKGKYQVLISIDEINYRLNIAPNQSINATDEKLEIMKLLSKIRKLPYLEWGNQRGSKIDRIVETIEKYAQKNNIYLYKSNSLTLEEWILYISDLVRKTDKLCNELEALDIPENKREELRGIVEGLRNEINTIKQNSLAETTIEREIERVQQFCERVRNYQEKLRDLGFYLNNSTIRNLAHNYNNKLTIAIFDSYNAQYGLSEPALGENTENGIR